MKIVTHTKKTLEQRVEEFQVPWHAADDEIKKQVEAYVKGTSQFRMLKAPKNDVAQWHRLPLRISRLGNEEIADRLAFTTSCGARAGEDLATVGSLLSSVKAHQTHFEAAFYLQFGNEDSRRFMIDAMRSKNKEWTDREFQLLVLESRKKMLEAVKAKYDGFAAVLSREITRRTKSFETENRNANF
jgi:hypothetical protein